MTVKLLTNEHHLVYQSLKGGCTGSSESIHVKMPHCWKSHVPAQLYLNEPHNKKATNFVKCLAQDILFLAI